jgi:hypothetical protein
MGEVRRTFDAISNYLRDQVQSIPRPDAVRSTLGVLILGLGIFAIVGYFPIYQHVLRTVLNLPRQESHSLALLLIIFIGLTGVVADITTRYGRRREGEASSRDGEGDRNASEQLAGDESQQEENTASASAVSGWSFGYLLWVFLLALIALSLLMFQGMLYLEFYQARAAEGSRIPFALGTAALFIAGIEMLNFYWATRLAIDFIAWLLIHALLLAPPYLLAKGAFLVERVFQALPSRVQEVISEGDARRIANVHILTKLGDHLRATAPERFGTNGSWRVRVMDKTSGEEQGELRIDGRTGDVEWYPVAGNEVRHEVGRRIPTPG